MSSFSLPEPSLSQLDAHLEACGLADRVSALQQLLGSLQNAKEHALVLGEHGIGKTALLNSALHYLKASSNAPSLNAPKVPFYWVVHLTSPTETLQSPLALLQALVTAWQCAAQQRLSQGLEDANALLAPLGLRWGQEELIRAVTLMRLQWDMDQLGSAMDMLPRQRLANAIRSAMPFSKRVHFSSVNLGVKQLVERLSDPWLAVAAQWIQPVAPEIVEALALIAPSVTPSETTAIPSSSYTEEEPYLPEEPTFPASAHSLHSSDAALEVVLTALHWVNTQLKPTPVKPTPATTFSPAASTLNTPVVVAIDGLEHLAQLPADQRQTLQKTLQQLMAQSSHHWWLTCASDCLSQALAGPLLKQCHTVVTLEPLSQRQQRRWFTQALSQHALAWEDPALDRLAASTQGNPFWLDIASTLILERLLATNTSVCTLGWIISLGIDDPRDWLETAWARAQMTLEPLQATLKEGVHWNPLQTVADALEYTAPLGENAFWEEAPWLANTANADSTQRRLAVGVMAALAQFGFLITKEIAPTNTTTHQWTSQTHRQFLLEKTRWIRANLPNDAKLAYLQKIIPLSAQASELDGPRVSELLSLGKQSLNTADFQSLQTSLEDALLKASQHSHTQQRLAALDGLAQLASPLALETLQKAFQDSHPTVREYALRYWVTLLKKSLKTGLPSTMGQHILAALTPCLDDTEPTIRWWAYALTSQLPIEHNTPATVTIFLKGAFDQSPSVRQLAIQHLGQADAHSAQVRQTLMTLAQTDPEESIRYEACKSLQHQPHPKVLETLLGVLEHDTNTRNRSLAVQLLSQYRDPLISETFRNALVTSDNTFSDDVRLTLIRALRVFSGEATEAALQTLFKTPELPLELSWAIIRTFHEIAQTPQTLLLLKNFFTKTSDATLKMACLSASQVITERLNKEGDSHTTIPAVELAISI